MAGEPTEDFARSVLGRLHVLRCRDHLGNCISIIRLHHGSRS